MQEFQLCEMAQSDKFQQRNLIMNELKDLLAKMMIASF